MLTTSVNLLERVRHREDQAAWERFVALYSPLLLRWAQRAGLPRHDAFDLVQDVLVTLLHELPSFNYRPDRGAFRSWLRTLTVRQAAARRVRPPAAAMTADALSETVASNDEPWEEAEYREFLVRRALEVMKQDFEDSTWRACWEHAVSGRTAAEVGRLLGLSEGAVYVAKCRVLRRLREELQGLLE